MTRKTQKGEKLKTVDAEWDVGKTTIKHGREITKISKDSVLRWKRNYKQFIMSTFSKGIIAPISKQNNQRPYPSFEKRKKVGKQIYFCFKLKCFGNVFWFSFNIYFQ